MEITLKKTIGFALGAFVLFMLMVQGIWMMSADNSGVSPILASAWGAVSNIVTYALWVAVAAAIGACFSYILTGRKWPPAAHLYFGIFPGGFWLLAMVRNYNGFPIFPDYDAMTDFYTLVGIGGFIVVLAMARYFAFDRLKNT